jgi:TonB family protein
MRWAAHVTRRGGLFVRRRAVVSAALPMIRLPLRPTLALLLITAACSHAPAVRLPPGPTHLDESASAADLRARILRRNADVYACYQEAVAVQPLTSREASTTLGYNRELQRFSFERPPKEPDAPTVPPSPFRAAFERCLTPRVAAWALPMPPGGGGPGAHFHFLPQGVPLPTAADPDERKRRPYGELPAAMDPAWSSPLFDEDGVRGYVDITEMIPPRRLSGDPMRYTAEALEKRTEGLMQVRCRITVEGTLRDCTVVRSLPGLDQMALDAFSTQRYTPVLFRGKPVELDYTFTVQFKLPRG